MTEIPDKKTTGPERGSAVSSSTSGRPRVLIVGGGFAGIHAARALEESAAEIWLIDRHNYHTFQPLLYQVATAGLEPGQIAHSIRGIFQDRSGPRFLMGHVVEIEPEDRALVLEDGTRITYDYLILAAGAATEYFGIEGAREHALPLKSLEDATRIRNHVLAQFEAAARNVDRLEEGRLTVAVVGGGPTGVEMAGALAELTDEVLARDFPELDMGRVRIVLVEMEPHVLGSYQARLREYALDELREKGVEVILGDGLREAGPRSVTLESGQVIRTRTLIWAAGVGASPLADTLGTPQGPGGRLEVAPDLHVPAYPRIYVAGDLSGATDQEGRPYPQLAPVAIQQGRHAGRQVASKLESQPTEPFRYEDPGMMATIGRRAAVVQRSGGFTLTGTGAWLVWVVLHIWELIGFRNRLSVMLDWIYSYFTYDRSPRLLFKPERRTTPESPPIHV